MTTKEVRPAVREMAERLRKEWIREGGETKQSAYVSGYLRARADVEAEVLAMHDRNTLPAQRAVIGAVLYEIRNPPAPLHPAVVKVCAQLRKVPPAINPENHAAADALEAEARKNGWVSK